MELEQSGRRSSGHLELELIRKAVALTVEDRKRWATVPAKLGLNHSSPGAFNESGGGAKSYELVYIYSVSFNEYYL